MSWKQRRRQQLEDLDAKRRKKEHETAERKRQSEENRHWESMRRNSEAAFQAARALAGQFGAARETTPKAITPYMLARCQELEQWPPDWVPVESTPDGLYNFCHPALDLHVKRHGGEKVPGWCIWEWSGVVLTFEFHSCWQDPTGRMVDIIRKPLDEKTILFLRASPIRSEADYLWPGVPNPDSVVTQYVEVTAQLRKNQTDMRLIRDQLDLVQQLDRRSQ
jgi:hypothetical protein